MPEQFNGYFAEMGRVAVELGNAAHCASCGLFLKFAVQDGDGAVAFTQGCFELGDLGIFGGQPGP